MLNFIYNPTAGHERASHVRTTLEARLNDLGVAHRFHETHGRQDAKAIARKLTEGRPGPVDIVAMGGDGTLNEVLNGIADPAGVRLGLIPCGSGNDFAAAARIPSDPVSALDIILGGEARFTDYMECSGVRGINIIGTGIDVDILRRYAKMKLLRGSAAYLASLLITLFSYRPYDFEEVSGGTAVRHHAFIACAGNGVSYGGGIPICPKAVIDDGQLDVVIVDDIRKPSIPRAFIRLMQKRVLELRTTSFKRQGELHIRSEKPMPIQIDGEIYEDLPFDVVLIHDRLRMYRPG